MRLPFQAYADLEGNLNAMDGTVIDIKTGAVFRTGAGGTFTHAAPSADYQELKPVAGGAGAAFVGGSGRNLICTGGVAASLSGPSSPDGHFRPEIPNVFRNGVFMLGVTGASAATISDETDIVVELTTGGTAPVGTYNSTTYGADTYNEGVPFSLTLAAEEGGPGAVLDAILEVSGGSAMAGLYTAVDAANLVSAVDPDWTLALDPSGSAEHRYLGVAVATRAIGLGYDPSGKYEAVEAAYFYNPVPPDDADIEDVPETNPFGILTIVYSWAAMPDLDTGTTFLGNTVGFGHGASAGYMSWTGDETATGSETVTIDLAQAWEDGEIETFADINCAADWYPGASPSQGHGPATLDITYSIGGVTLFSGTINPGLAGPASTLVKALRISMTATIETSDAPWTATVRRVPRPTREGFLHLEVIKVDGVTTTINGPAFSTALPAAFDETSYLPIAHSDGAGVIEQFILGGIVIS